MAGLNINSSLAVSVEATGKTTADGLNGSVATYVRSPMISSYLRPRYEELDTRTNHTGINTRPTGYKHAPIRTSYLTEWGGQTNLHDRLIGVLLRGAGFTYDGGAASPAAEGFDHVFTIVRAESANGQYLSAIHHIPESSGDSVKLATGCRLTNIGLEVGRTGASLTFDGLGLGIHDVSTETTATALASEKTGATCTDATPIVVTATSHGYSNGNRVYISGMTEATELNGNWYTIDNVDANTFELVGTTTATIGTAETTGGTVRNVDAVTSDDGATFLLAGSQSSFTLSSTHLTTPANVTPRSFTMNIEVSLDEEQKSLSSFTHSDLFLNHVAVTGMLRGVPFTKELYEDLTAWDGAGTGVATNATPSMNIPEAVHGTNAGLSFVIANDSTLSSTEYPQVQIDIRKAQLAIEPFDITGDGQILVDIAWRMIDDNANETAGDSTPLDGEPIKITLRNDVSNSSSIYAGS